MISVIDLRVVQYDYYLSWVFLIQYITIFQFKFYRIKRESLQVHESLNTAHMPLNVHFLKSNFCSVRSSRSWVNKTHNVTFWIAWNMVFSDLCEQS